MTVNASLNRRLAAASDNAEGGGWTPTANLPDIDPGWLAALEADAEAVARGPRPNTTAAPSTHQGTAPPARFKFWTMRELLAQDLTYSWLVKRVLVDPTYGMIAGELKTLKSYVGGLLDVSVASGVPLFGEFAVDKPGTVLTFVGEGGLKPWTRRTGRMAEAVGVDAEDLPIIPTFDVGAIDSERFRGSLLDQLDQHRPVLVHLDPYYAYHGAQVDYRNLHAEGDLLASLSATCAEVGATLLVNNHFNQTGSGQGLKRITGAGSGEWADSWVMLSHREPPDVAGGRFWLRMEIGSRQWGGNAWNLDLTIGRFDPDTGTHDGPITWNLTEADTGSDGRETAAERQQARLADARTELIAMFRKARKPLTKTEAKERIVGFSSQVKTAALAGLIDDEFLELVPSTTTDAAGRARDTDRWVLAGRFA